MHPLISPLGLTFLVATTTLAQSQQKSISSTSFSSCSYNNASSRFTPSAFNVTINPYNQTLLYSLRGKNTFSGNDTIQIEIQSDRQVISTITIDPCEVEGTAGLCPASGAAYGFPIDVRSNATVPEGPAMRLEGDLEDDGEVQVRLKLNGSSVGMVNGEFGCVVARFGSNSNSIEGGAGSSMDGSSGDSSDDGDAGNSSDVGNASSDSSSDGDQSAASGALDVQWTSTATIVGLVCMVLVVGL